MAEIVAQRLGQLGAGSNAVTKMMEKINTEASGKIARGA